MNEKLRNELKNDMKRIADVIDEVQRKHGGIYITANHCEGETELLASVTTLVNGIYRGYSKFAKDDDNGPV